MRHGKTATTRAALLTPFIAYYTARGGQIEVLLDHLGMKENPFDDGQLLVPIHKAHETMEFISKELAEPYLGARIGQTWAETQGPPFERAKENVTSLSQLFVKLTQFFPTEVSTGGLSFSATSTHAEVLGKRSYQPGPAAAHGSAAMVAFILTFIKNAVGDSWDGESVLVRTPNRENLPSWLVPPSSVFASTAEDFFFRFPVEWCDAKPVFHRSCDDVVVASDFEHSIDGGVLPFLKQKILSSPSNVKLKLTDAAAELDVSSRTLQRTLKAQGTTFQLFASDVRLEEARRQLEESASPIQEIATSLGFSSSTNFTRDFRRKFGLTPTDYRRVRD